MRRVFRFVLVQNQLLLVMTGLLLFLPASAFGQATSGVTGVVTDASGAIIVGAEARLENSEGIFCDDCDKPGRRISILTCAAGRALSVDGQQGQLPNRDSFRLGSRCRRD